jgi:hypothetical protein
MWIKTSEQLPPEGKYVLGRHNRGTWRDSTDQANVNCVVVKLLKGISKEERQKMKDSILPDEDMGPRYSGRGVVSRSLRSRIVTSDDEDGNNLVPYSFHEFGPDHFFGQDITHWQPIEDFKE